MQTTSSNTGGNNIQICLNQSTPTTFTTMTAPKNILKAATGGRPGATLNILNDASTSSTSSPSSSSTVFKAISLNSNSSTSFVPMNNEGNPHAGPPPVTNYSNLNHLKLNVNPTNTKINIQSLPTSTTSVSASTTPTNNPTINNLVKNFTITTNTSSVSTANAAAAVTAAASLFNQMSNTAEVNNASLPTTPTTPSTITITLNPNGNKLITTLNNNNENIEQTTIKTSQINLPPAKITVLNANNVLPLR